MWSCLARRLWVSPPSVQLTIFRPLLNFSFGFTSLNFQYLNRARFGYTGKTLLVFNTHCTILHRKKCCLL